MLGIAKPSVLAVCCAGAEMFPVFAVKFAMNSELVSVVSKLSFAVSSVLMLLVMFTGLFATVVFVPSPLTSVIFTSDPLEVMSVCGGVAAFAKNVDMKIAAKIAVEKDTNMVANLVFGLEILSLSLFLRENFDVLKLGESLVLLLFFLCLMKKMIARMIAAMPSVSKMVVKRLVWAKSVSVLRKPVDGAFGVVGGGVLGSG